MCIGPSKRSLAVDQNEKSSKRGTNRTHKPATKSQLGIGPGSADLLGSTSTKTSGTVAGNKTHGTIVTVKNCTAPSYKLSDMSSAEASLLLLHSLGIPIDLESIKRSIANAAPLSMQVNNRNPLAPVIINKSTNATTRCPVTQLQGTNSQEGDMPTMQAHSLSSSVSKQHNVQSNSISDNSRVCLSEQSPTVVPCVAQSHSKTVSSGRTGPVQSLFNLASGGE